RALGLRINCAPLRCGEPSHAAVGPGGAWEETPSSVVGWADEYTRPRGLVKGAGDRRDITARRRRGGRALSAAIARPTTSKSSATAIREETLISREEWGAGGTSRPAAPRRRSR